MRRSLAVLASNFFVRKPPWCPSDSALVDDVSDLVKDVESKDVSDFICGGGQAGARHTMIACVARICADYARAPAKSEIFRCGARARGTDQRCRMDLSDQESAPEGAVKKKQFTLWPLVFIAYFWV